MQITVFAVRFEDAGWVEWEHMCDLDETEIVVDAARTLAFEHAPFQKPLDVDYLGGARYVFDVARGTLEKPVHGDMQVYDVKVAGIAMEEFEEYADAFAARKTA
jgi:hypothetical protein